MNIMTTSKMTNSSVKRQEIVNKVNNTKEIYAVLKLGNRTQKILMRTERI